MSLVWTDTLEIVLALCDKYPEVDPQKVRFTELYQWILALPGFEDDPKRCNEKILEAVQMVWMEEVT